MKDPKENKQQSSRKTVPEEEAYHDTKLLLRKYRKVAYQVKLEEEDLNMCLKDQYSVEFSTYEVNAELAGIDLSGTKLEGRVQSVYLDKSILEMIQLALNRVREDPDNGEMLYQLLYLTYFSPQKAKNVWQITETMDKLGFPMSQSTYYAQMHKAIHAFDLMLFGYTSKIYIDVIGKLFGLSRSNSGDNPE